MTFPPLREELVGLAPYGAPQLDVPVQLNVNENPYPPSAAVVADIAASVASVAGSLNRYPDREFTELRTALAAYLNTDGGQGVTPAQVWAANGSNEVMLHLLQAFGGPGADGGQLRADVLDVPGVRARHRHPLGRGTSRGRLRARPGRRPRARAARAAQRGAAAVAEQPDGHRAAARHRRGPVRGGCGDGLVVVDEAYAEFRRTGTPSALELLPSLRNLVVSRTMSKAFALAGARLGYLAAAPEICDAIRVVRLPYHLGAVTQAAALAALRHADELLARVDDLRAERDATAGWLTGLGLEVAESDANFVLFGRYADRHAVWQGLLDHGVLIREVGPDGWLRVSVGTAEEMAAFRDALTALGTPARLEEAR